MSRLAYCRESRDSQPEFPNPRPQPLNHIIQPIGPVRSLVAQDQAGHPAGGLVGTLGHVRGLGPREYPLTKVSIQLRYNVLAKLVKIMKAVLYPTQMVSPEYLGFNYIIL